VTLAVKTSVGALAEPGPPLVVALLAALKAGRPFVPLSPDFPDERLRTMAEDAGVGVLVTQAALAEHAVRVAALAGIAEVVVVDADEPEDPPEPAPGVRLRWHGDVAAAEPLAANGRVASDTVAYVVYTSGSTGVPKGVPITHANVVPLLLWQEEHFGLGPEARALQTLSPSFDFGLQEILTSVLFGGSLVFPGPERLRAPARYAQFAGEQRVTTMYVTPTYADQVTAAREPIPSLRTILIGGELLHWGTVRALRSLVGEDCVIFNGYGPTEASINAAMLRIDADAEADAATPVPVGRVTGASRVYVVGRSLELVPPGVVGEVAIGGPGVATGYLGRPAATAERFVPDPYAGEPGARMYLTGDHGRLLEAGELEILGRVDDQVKIRGFRVELGEIEAALAAHELVRDCAVALRDDDGAGPLLVAYVVPADGKVDEDALREHLRERVPAYMVPAAFVPLERLPLTPNGKVDRRALPRPRRRPAAAGGPPRTALETTIAAVWEEVLDVRGIGLDDSFFDLGGHSLLAARAQARLAEAIAREVEIHTLFECPTVRTLAGLLSDGDRHASLRQSERRRRAREQRLQRHALRHAGDI
jgi:amino acid adenylation domain-containing protein